MTTGDDGRPYGTTGDDQGAYYGQGYGGADYGQSSYGASYPQTGAGHDTGATPLPQAGSISPTEAVKAGWRMFTGNPLPWILMTLVYAIISGILGQFNQPIGDDPTTVSFTVMSGVATLVSFVVGLLFQAFIIRGALLEVDGHKPSFGDFFKLHNFGMFVLAMILVAIATTLGLIALLVGAIVVAFFLYWTGHFAIDRNMSAVDAVKSSFNAIKSDAGNLLGLAVLNLLIIFVGALALLVGLLAAIPVTTLASVYAYRVITGPSDFSQRATGGVPQGY